MLKKEGGILKKILSYLVVATIMIALFGAVLFEGAHQAQAYDANNLISDAEFTNWRTLDVTGVQQFLNSHAGTRLRTFSEGGRSAAQIIADAARANGINPFVILATIQKEESIVDSNYNFDYRVVWAMGYGVCDSCSLDDPDVSKYRGFTNQVNNGTWQLGRNYNYWASNGSDWNVGRTMIIDDAAIRFSNRATSALYRYTPHLHGNENFNRIYNAYKTFRGQGVSGAGTYAASFYGQSYNPGRTINLKPGQRLTIYARYKNNGTAYWYQGGANPARLGNSSPNDRSSVFTGGNTRWRMSSSRIGPRQIANFTTVITAPSEPGTYTEKFKPLIEGITWMDPEATFIFKVGGSPTSNNSVVTSAGSYGAELTSQYNNNATINLKPGQRLTIYANYRNTGSARWYQSGANPTYLGNSSPLDRSSVFTGGNTRWRMVSASIANNQIGMFRTTITAPSQKGTYTEKFQPVVEGVSWMGEEVTFNFNVR